jgi:hypothetical protein
VASAASSSSIGRMLIACVNSHAYTLPNRDSVCCCVWSVLKFGTQVERISKKIILAAGLRSVQTFTSFGHHGDRFRCVWLDATGIDEEGAMAVTEGDGALCPRRRCGEARCATEATQSAGAEGEA